MQEIQELLKLSRKYNKKTIPLSKVISISSKIELSSLNEIKDFNYDFDTSMKGIMGVQTAKVTHLTTLFFKSPERLNTLLKNKYFKEALEQHEFISNKSKMNIYHHPINLIDGAKKHKIIKIIIENNVNFNLQYNFDVKGIEDLKSLLKNAGVNYLQVLAVADKIEFNGKNSLIDIKPLVKSIEGKENFKDTIFSLIQNSSNNIETFSLEDEKFKKFCSDVEYLKDLIGDKEIRYTEKKDNSFYFRVQKPQDIINEAISQNDKVYKLYLKKGINEILFNENDSNIVPIEEDHIQFKI